MHRMSQDYSFKLRKQDPFYSELHQEVMQYFRQHGLSPKATPVIWRKLLFLLIAMVVLYYAVFFGPLSFSLRLPLALLLGACIAACGFSVSHEALHNNLSRHQRVNRILGYSMDLLGSSSFLWKINHGAHHSFTNVHGLDGDIKDSMWIRLCPYAPFRAPHRFQLITAVLLYASFYLLIVFVFNTLNILGRNFGNGERRRIPRRQLWAFVLFKLLYLLLWFVLPVLFGPLNSLQFLQLYLMAAAVAGLSFSTIFFLAHNVLEVKYDQAPATSQASWAEHQLRTTCNFKAGPLGFFLGGLHYQVEHHLFPQICSAHFPAVAAIVQRVAAAHGIPYRSNKSLGRALHSHAQLLWRLSRP